MAFIEWTKEYSVGVQEIDEQHKQLVQLTNELYTAIVGNYDDIGLRKTFQGLIDYVKVHFSHEEGMMAKVNYPGLEPHQAKHRELVTRIVNYFKEYQAKMASGADSKHLSKEVLMFLRDWLFHHILETDMKYRDHFHARGIK